MRSPGEQAARKGRQAANSKTMEVLARGGLASRGVIYVLVGVLAIQVALGQGEQADEGGALKSLAAGPAGDALLWVMALGLVALVIWRVTAAMWGSPKAMDRALNAGRAVVYAAVCAAVVSAAVGGGSSSSDKKSQALTAQAMALPGGQFIVGLVGVAIVVTGVVFVVYGARRMFEKHLRSGEMSRATRKVVVTLGLVGNIARGIVFGGVGVFVGYAAVTFDPDKAKGMDDTLKTFRDTPAGPWLLLLMAVGLVLFGVYCACEAWWYREAS
ncbi:MAG TPA: DUF1206 domain-containing protein [Streptosporangiaceae bacterium]|jgi:hypothetical protein